MIKMVEAGNLVDKIRESYQNSLEWAEKQVWTTFAVTDDTARKAYRTLDEIANSINGISLKEKAIEGGMFGFILFFPLALKFTGLNELPLNYQVAVGAGFVAVGSTVNYIYD